MKQPFVLFHAVILFLAFLPLSAAVLASSTLISRALLPRVAPRWLMAPGLTVGAIGTATLALLHAGDGFALHVLPGRDPARARRGRGVRAGVLDRHAWHGQREAGVASAAAILLAAALLVWLLVTVGPPEADQSR